MPTFGPGTLKLGEVATPIDVSCLVNSFTIEPEKEQEDDVTKLCGNVVPGAITYTYTAGGNLDIDPDDPDGVFHLSWANPGAQVPFEYTPNTEDGTKATGTLVLDPMAFGGDEYGTVMNSDVEWAIVGKPTITPGPGADPVNRFAQKVRDGLRAPLTDAPVIAPRTKKTRVDA